MKKQLEFRDLTEFDLNIIRDLARKKFDNSKEGESSTFIVETVFDCIRSMGFDIVQSDREATWSKLSKGHFTEYTPPIDWWKKG